MAKTKYPKKFRQKLEQIRDAREARERDKINPYCTFAHTAAAAWKVQGVYVGLDEEKLKVHQRFYWTPRSHRRSMSIKTTLPPWVQING